MCVCVCMGGRVRASVRACVYACVRACVCVCMCDLYSAVNLTLVKE